MLTENQTIKKERYCIKNPLGRNGNGFYYEAYDSELKKLILLKEIPESLNKVTTITELESRKNAFAEKAKILSGIEHDSLITIKDYFSEINNHYLVMERKSGDTLAEMVEKKKSGLPLTLLLNWADQILEAISYLHNQNPPIFHLDIKPENIKLTHDGRVKLTTHSIINQLNIKKEPVSGEKQFDSANLAFSPFEQIWEYLDFASQNVILNSFDEVSQKVLEQPADARSDIYSLGATLYYLATARIPFDALTRMIEVMDGNKDPLVAPHEINSNIPLEISDILMKSLEIKRENRISSAAIMKQIFRTAITKVKERGTNNVQESPEDFENVLELPEPEPIFKQEPVTVKPIDESQKQQLERIKNQLREAENRRIAAEKRAAEAERLLREKEEQAKGVKESPAEKPFEPEKPLQTVEWGKANAEEPAENSIHQVEEIQTDAVESVFEKAEPEEIATDSQELLDPLKVQKKTETESVRSSFDDYYEESESNSGSPFVKIAVGAIVLLVLGGVGFGIWSFYGSGLKQTGQTGGSNKVLEAPAKTENTPMPDAVESAAESEFNSEEAAGNSAENTDNAESSPNATETVAPPTTARSQPAPTKRNTVPAKPNDPPQETKQPAKPAPTKKKSVTLDDLLKDS